MEGELDKPREDDTLLARSAACGSMSMFDTSTAESIFSIVSSSWVVTHMEGGEGEYQFWWVILPNLIR